MNKDGLRMHAIGMVFVFIVQFLAGMTLNLFVKLPSVHPGSSSSNYFAGSAHSLMWALSGSGGAALATHAYMALLLVLGCLALFVRGLVLRNHLWSIVGAISSLFTIGAAFNGLSFIDYGHNVSSMIMATCWLVAVFTMIYGIVKANKLPLITG